MATPDEPPALAYIEKTLADAYRKEIDQEENVWRSLPFFAATLALQLAALFQIIDKVSDPTTVIGWISIVLLAAAGALTLASLGFLAASIYPQRFDYVAKQGALLTYARDLIRDEQAPDNRGQADPFSALVTRKTELARQYAQATDHNQQINKRRERRRSIAGLAALGSVLITVFLVGTTYPSREGPWPCRAPIHHRPRLQRRRKLGRADRSAGRFQPPLQCKWSLRGGGCCATKRRPWKNSNVRTVSSS